MNQDRSWIYLDYAATSFRKPPQVKQAVCEALDCMGNAGRGVHEASLAGSRRIYQARQQLADFLGAQAPRQVVFTANATESLNLVLQGLLGTGDHVITTAWEHNSVLRPLYRLALAGLEISVLPTEPEGGLCYDKLTELLRKNTKLVVINHASNVTGDVAELATVASFCRQRGLLFVVDASQTAGVMPVSLIDDDLDVLCFTGHKGLLGPQGTGGVCIRQGVSIRPLKVGGSGVQSFSPTHPLDMPTALEAGTLNGHGIAGLAAGVSYILEQGRENLYCRERQWMECFYEGIRVLPAVKVYGDFSCKRRVPIVSLTIGSEDSGRMADVLAQEFSILTRPGAHCAPLIHQRLGTEKQGMVRFSFSHFSTAAEVEQAIYAVTCLAKRYG